jgi:hypothetical protein
MCWWIPPGVLTNSKNVTQRNNSLLRKKEAVLKVQPLFFSRNTGSILPPVSPLQKNPAPAANDQLLKILYF